MQLRLSRLFVRLGLALTPLLLLAVAARAAPEPKPFTIDSGWATSLPSLRSAGIVGQNTLRLFEHGYGENLPANLALAAVETTVAWQYLTCLHELGHANHAKATGHRSRFETDDASWWSYLTGHKLFSEAAVYFDDPEVEGFAFYAAGFNASTHFAEHTPISSLSGLTFVLPARFSALLYVLSPQPGALDDTLNISEHYRARGWTIRPSDIRRWQGATFLASASTWAVVRRLLGKTAAAPGRWTPPEFYSYLNPDGISLRATNTVALTENFPLELAYEAVLQGRFRHEIEVGTRLALAPRTSLHPRLLLSDHGAGGELRAEYIGDKVDVVVGCRVLDPSTLVGARESRSTTRTTTETYAQLRLALF